MIFERINISFDGTEFENYFCEELHQSAVFEPHALELLNYLKDGYILCAASNGPYEQQYNRLKVGGIDTYFSHIFISSAIGAKSLIKNFLIIAFQSFATAEAKDFCQKKLLLSVTPLLRILQAEEITE